MDERKIILCGLGGQGVVFLTRLLSQTAVALGRSVVVSETHGMSQRGGSVISHLKLGGTEAPLIRRGTADLLLALEPDEAVRQLVFLRPGGTAIVNAEQGLRSEIAPHLRRLQIAVLRVPADRIAVELGTPAVANVVLAGFAAAHPVLGLPMAALRRTLVGGALRRRDLNARALEAGFQAAVSHTHATI